MQSQSQWYLDSRFLKSTQEIYKNAIAVFQRDPCYQEKFDTSLNLKTMDDLATRIKHRQSKYEAQHQDHKAAKWLLKLSSRIGHYGRVFDVLVQHHPEYVSLAWGAMKFLFVLVENHGKQVRTLSKGMVRIADVLPRIEFAHVLYTTPRMQGAVFQVYSHVIDFLLRAEHWYQQGKLRHAWEAFSHPVELEYDDLIANIEESTREIEKLAAAGAQAEQRDMHLKILEISAKLKSHEDLLQNQEGLLLEMRGLLLSQQAIQTSANLDTKQRLTDLQMNQIMDFLSGSGNLDPHKTLQYRALATSRLRNRHHQSEAGQRFWMNPKFTHWESSSEPSLLMVKGDYMNRQEVQSFTINVIQMLCREKVPTLWILRSLPTNPRASLLVTDVIKSLVCQAIQLNSSLHTESSLALSCARFRTADTSEEWLDLLASVIAAFPQLYIIIDIDSVDRIYCKGFSWISQLYSMFQRHSLRKWISRLKILIVSYGFNAAHHTDLAKYKRIIVPTRQFVHKVGFSGTSTFSRSRQYCHNLGKSNQLEKR